MTIQEEKDRAKRILQKREQEYREARKKYEKLGVACMEKGPYSFEAETGYPRAKEEYHKKGRELKTLRLKLKEMN